MSVFDRIRDWSEDRGLHNGNPVSQMCKLIEEVGEIAHAVCRKNEPEMADGIGDTIVVLTILAQQMGWKVEHCIERAYLEIAERKGTLKDGVFVKETL